MNYGPLQEPCGALRGICDSERSPVVTDRAAFALLPARRRTTRRAWALPCRKAGLRDAASPTSRPGRSIGQQRGVAKVQLHAQRSCSAKRPSSRKMVPTAAKARQLVLIKFRAGRFGQTASWFRVEPHGDCATSPRCRGRWDTTSTGSFLARQGTRTVGHELPVVPSRRSSTADWQRPFNLGGRMSAAVPGVRHRQCRKCLRHRSFGSTDSSTSRWLLCGRDRAFGARSSPTATAA